MSNLSAPHAQKETATRQPGRWRMRSAALLAALVMAVGLSVVGISPAPAQAAGPSAPTWLVNWLKSRPENFVKGKGNDLVGTVMESLGFTCAGGAVCWREGSYDPPRWFWGAHIETGNGPNGYLRARGWPKTNAAVIRTFPEQWKLTIFCQTTGDWVYGRWGWTNTWDYVGHKGDAPMFVSDGFVWTGTNGYVAGNCGATNMGDNP